MTRVPFRTLLLLALAAVASLTALAGPATAHDATVVRAGESIQAAVDAAAPGTKIVVKRGTYAENVVIATDGITLKGRGAKLVPPASPAPNACSSDGQPAADGICVLGQVEFPADGPPVVTDPVDDVTIKGFKVSGFAGNGILFLGATDPVVKDNRLKDNGEYGIARFVSSGGTILRNAASGSEEAGIYVGDSPDADVLVAGNVAYDNHLFGFFFRDAANGRVVGNEAFGNCVGAIVLNTGANIAANWRFFGNEIHDNDGFCPGSEEEGTPPLTAIGVLIAGASDNVLIGNRILDNDPNGEAPFKGGVVVVDIGIPGANPPSGNLVKGNLILGNDPDIFWDGSGTGNVIKRNVCRTSVPDGLCERHHGHRGHHKGHDDHDHKHHGHRKDHDHDHHDWGDHRDDGRHDD